MTLSTIITILLATVNKRDLFPCTVVGELVNRDIAERCCRYGHRRLRY